ncbi:hypothetical protein F8388_015004 [Cannabis sativa]|uniref:Uncharacterized protein n=1 Tax=Cannabis sativa TaxID=3483 RepID=A0A7J6DQR6_CANSA|nr:hypothetical protein F8388_015004 [Cannabis sativa]
MQKKRGATQKNNINDLKSKGVKKNLEYNDKGQPIGDNYGEMQSYIGVRTRKTVSLNAGDWRRVSITLKNKIWEDVSGAFNIDEGMKKKKKELGVDHVERCEVWIRSREKKKSMVTDLDGQIKERIVSVSKSSATISSWFGRKKRQPVAKYISEMDAEIERLKAEIDALKRETKQADQLQNVEEEYNDEDQGPLLKKPRLETSASKGRGKQKCNSISSPHPRAGGGERCSTIASDGAAIDPTHQDRPPRTTKSKARKPHKMLTH